MKTFEQLSGTRVQIGASGHHWLDSECPLLRNDVCRIPPHVPPMSPVPEPASALLIAVGIVCVFLWRRHG